MIDMIHSYGNENPWIIVKGFGNIFQYTIAGYEVPLIAAKMNCTDSAWYLVPFPYKVIMLSNL